MKKQSISVLLIAVLVLSLLSGCVQIDNTVNINKDGSGSFDSVTYMNKALLDEFLADNDKGIDDSILEGTTVVTLEDGKEYYSRVDSRPFDNIKGLDTILHAKNEFEADAANARTDSNETQNPAILGGHAQIQKIDGITYLEVSVAFAGYQRIEWIYNIQKLVDTSKTEEFAKAFRTQVTFNLPAEVFAIEEIGDIDIINNKTQVIVNYTPVNEGTYTGSCGLVIKCMLDNDGSAASPVVKPFDGQTFKDVKGGDWFYVGVGRAYMQGLMTGVSADTFNPHGTMTVSEVLTLTARLHSQFNKSTLDTTVNPGEAWYQPYVNYLVNSGIITSTEFNSYTRPVTRAEMAHLMYKATPADQLNAVSSLTPPDVKGNTYANEIIALYKAGILTGNDDRGTFAPGTEITRAEVALIVARITNTGLRVQG